MKLISSLIAIALLVSACSNEVNNQEAEAEAEADENICWPQTGSGEIDIFEHHGDHGTDQFTTGAIRNIGGCEGDWRPLRIDVKVSLNEYHKYSVEWAESDLVYRVDWVKHEYRSGSLVP
jgi:hypothetical protein